jgi:hemoglobin
MKFVMQDDTEIAKRSEISVEAIQLLVYRFYEQVRLDPVLGPVFNPLLEGKWDSHLPRMVDFWSSVLLRSASFQGNVYGTHMALTGISEQHFRHWLSLFRDCVLSLFSDPAAAEILVVADRIAASLQFGFFGTCPVRLANLDTELCQR